MISKDELRRVLPPTMGKNEIIVRNQTTDDIITEILDADAAFTKQYDLIAKFFEGSSDLVTAKNIWSFLRKNVRYVIEGDEKQTTCSPALLLQRGTGDCKHYSLFTSGILRALGIPHVFRFASYNVFNRDPGHVYVMMGDVAIDAVLPLFNNQKTYIYHVDKKPKKAMLQRVSGFATDFAKLQIQNAQGVLPVANKFGRPAVNNLPAQRFQRLQKRKAYLMQVSIPTGRANTIQRVTNTAFNDGHFIISGFDYDTAQVGSLWGSITHAFHAVTDPVKQAAQFVAKPVAQAAKFVAKPVAQAVKWTGGEIAQGAKFVARTVVKIAGAPIRLAFLLCVDFNLFGLAENIYQGYQRDPDKIRNFWRDVGGDWGHFKGSINKGVKSKNHSIAGMAGIGVVAAAAPALASPLITAIIALLSSIGVAVASNLKKTAADGVEKIANGAFNPDGTANQNYKEGSGGGYQGSEYGLNADDMDYGSQLRKATDGMTPDLSNQSTTDIPTWVWFAGGATLLLAAKKFK